MAPTAVTQEPEDVQETIKRLAGLKVIGHSKTQRESLLDMILNGPISYQKPLNKDTLNMVLTFPKVILMSL